MFCECCNRCHRTSRSLTHLSYPCRYSSIGSFYFPALMMVFVYARIFIAARSRARKHIAKKRLKMPIESNAEALKEKSTTTTICTSFSNPSPPDLNKETVMGDSVAPLPPLSPLPPCPIQVNVCQDESSSSLAQPRSPAPQIIIEASPESRRQSWNIISTSELISSINITGEQPLAPGQLTEPSAIQDTGNSHSIGSTPENSETEHRPQCGNGAAEPDKASKVYFSTR